MAVKPIASREGILFTAPIAAPADSFKSVAPPANMSPQAKEHLGRIDKISADVLRDLEAVTEDIGKLRDEITLRARMLGEATVEFDELARTASQGYVSIRNAIDMLRDKFAAGMKPAPTLPVIEKPAPNGPASLVPDAPSSDGTAKPVDQHSSAT